MATFNTTQKITLNKQATGPSSASVVLENITKTATHNQGVELDIDITPAQVHNVDFATIVNASELVISILNAQPVMVKINGATTPITINSALAISGASDIVSVEIEAPNTNTDDANVRIYLYS